MSATPPPQPSTVLEFLNVTTDYFKKNGVESPRLEAELLLAKVLKTNRVGLYVKYDQPLQRPEVDAFRALVRERAKFTPIHYLLGSREFWSLEFKVRDGVLIPRPDTEVLVEEVLAALGERKAQPLRVADVGTGSGCLAVSLAKELSQAEVWAGDIADVPLEVARQNADDLGVGARVHVVRARGLAELLRASGGAAFDVIVSNPPYIPSGDLAKLPMHVRKEPHEALFAGADGLDVLRTIAADARAALAPGGVMVLEIGDATQAEAVKALLAEAGLTGLRTRDDYAGLARAVVARRPEGG